MGFWAIRIWGGITCIAAAFVEEALLRFHSGRSACYPGVHMEQEHRYRRRLQAPSEIHFCGLPLLKQARPFDLSTFVNNGGITSIAAAFADEARLSNSSTWVRVWGLGFRV